MSLIKECQQLFRTKNLYEILGGNKEQSQTELRKAFYRASLTHHPDRQEAKEKNDSTQRFQVLSRVYSILSDEDKRKIYDETGIVDEGEDLTDKSYDDWVKYWQLLFPKVTVTQIEQFQMKYKGSQEEMDDLINIYNRTSGDMDAIMETLLFACHTEEHRIRSMIDDLIDKGTLTALDNYSQEDEKKTQARAKRALTEEKRFAKAAKQKKKGNDGGDLAAAIRARHTNSLELSENFLDRLSQKYCCSKGEKPTKRLSQMSKKKKR